MSNTSTKPRIYRKDSMNHRLAGSGYITQVQSVVTGDGVRHEERAALFDKLRNQARYLQAAHTTKIPNPVPAMSMPTSNMFRFWFSSKTVDLRKAAPTQRSPKGRDVRV